ncbi:hypothetical protein H0Z11_14815 [Pantoea agglomerans]|uniref:hypothetical protein n=1 Tax=Enterobacter agglomerans TaxID=549 RepID=UPI001AA04DBC|nr:hypothetical protein [Pantoea agglomerans]QTC49511.1 hypothetical protein H0Z11_14815 [Pantoea agglomerans]
MCNNNKVRPKGYVAGVVWVVVFSIAFGVCLALVNSPFVSAMVGIGAFGISCLVLAFAAHSEIGIFKVFKCLGDVSAASLSLTTLISLPGWDNSFHYYIAFIVFGILCVLIAGRTYRSL